MTIPQLIDYSTQDILDLFRSAFYDEHGAPMLIGSDDFTASAVFSYVLSVLVNASNTAGAQRFIDSATGVYLDAIAAVNGLERPSAQPASALFHLVMANSGTLDTGELVVSDGNVSFSNIEPIAISDDCDALLYCTENGAKNNGIAIGAIDTIQDGTDYVSTASNTTISGGGTDGFAYTAEGDDAFREYIKQRRADFVVGGSAPAYKSRCMTVDARLLDVCILQDGDTGYKKGKVKIFTLWDKQTLNNTLEALLNTKVYDACNATDFRPIGDFVQVASAQHISHTISSFHIKYRLRDRDVAWQHMQDTFNAYKTYLKSGFRRALSESELTKMFCTPDKNGVSALGFDISDATAYWKMPDTGSVYNLAWTYYPTIDDYVSNFKVYFIDTEG